MRTLLIVTILGLTMATVGVAEAAPTGSCGEGGGVWGIADAVCAEDDEVCVAWLGSSVTCTFDASPIVCC